MVSLFREFSGWFLTACGGAEGWKWRPSYQRVYSEYSHACNPRVGWYSPPQMVMVTMSLGVCTTSRDE